MYSHWHSIIFNNFLLDFLVRPARLVSYAFLYTTYVSWDIRQNPIRLSKGTTLIFFLFRDLLFLLSMGSDLCFFILLLYRSASELTSSSSSCGTFPSMRFWSSQRPLETAIRWIQLALDVQGPKPDRYAEMGSGILLSSSINSDWLTKVQGSHAWFWSAGDTFSVLDEVRVCSVMYQDKEWNSAVH